MSMTAPGADARQAPASAQVRELLAGAARALLEAAGEGRAEDRFARAHLAALRTTAALLATRARPDGRSTRRRGGGLRSAWSLLAEIAPELAEWAAYFEAGAAKRGAAQAGVLGAVSEREADDLVRGVESFLALVADRVGLPAPTPGLPLGLAG